MAEIGCVNALLNKRDEAHNAIEELKARAAHEYIGETLIVYIYLALGDKEQAFVDGEGLSIACRQSSLAGDGAKVRSGTQ